jgi:long-subunit fatty acid transport protein
MAQIFDLLSAILHPRRAAGVCVALLAALLTTMPTSAQVLPSFGGDRAGTIGFQFLKIPVDARSAGMGQTAAANAFDASSLFWNPALAAQASGAQVGFTHTAYYADVSLEYAAATVPLRRAGLTVGISVQALNSGDMDETTELQPFGTGRTFRFTDVAAGLSVSQSLTDLFSYGVTAKYVRESVADVTANTVVFDLGVFYRVGTTGAQMGVAIRNFGLDAAFEGELTRTTLDGVVTETDFESVTPPTTFLLGLNYTALRDVAQHDLQVSGQLTNPADNAETFNVGAEYMWNELLILRAGYRFAVEEYSWPSFGAGLMLPIDLLQMRFDYGFSRLDRLGAIHRVGLNVQL